VDRSTSYTECDSEIDRCPAWRGGMAVGAVVYLSAAASNAWQRWRDARTQNTAARDRLTISRNLQQLLEHTLGPLV
jgi:hypothetical protein